MRRALLLIATTVAALAISLTTTTAAGTTVSSSAAAKGGRPDRLPGGFKHLVVLCEENHSCGNVYGGGGSVNSQEVDGLDQAPAAHTSEVAQDVPSYTCLLQND